MDITWKGRMYVNEKEITPEQYKMFFGRSEYGISFKTANKILECRQKVDMEECVPCDELNEDAIELIKDQIARMEELRGEIEYEGQTLCWSWDLLSISGWLEDKEYYANIDFFDLPDWVREKILDDMLIKECHWGMISV